MRGWSTQWLQSQKPRDVLVSLLSLDTEMLRLQSCAKLLPWHEGTCVTQRAWPPVKLHAPWLVLQHSWTDTTFQRQLPVKCLSGACLNRLVHGKLPFRLWFLRDGDVKSFYTWKCSQNDCANIYMCLSASQEDTAYVSLGTPLKWDQFPEWFSHCQQKAMQTPTLCTGVEEGRKRSF